MKSILGPAVLAACIVAGCTVVTPPIDKVAQPEKIARDAGLPSSTFDTPIACNVARATPGEKLAIFQPCFYVKFPDHVAIVTFDEKQGVYRLLKTVDASTVTAVGMKKMGRVRQIQVHSRSGFIVFDLLSKDRGWGNPDAAEKAFDVLKSLGIPVTDPVQLVMNYAPVNIRVNTAPLP